MMSEIDMDGNSVEDDVSEEESSGPEIDTRAADAFFLKIASDSFEASTSYFDANIRSSFERNIRQFVGRHDSDSKYNSNVYRYKSKLFRPKTRSAIRKHEAACAAAFFSTQDVVMVSPIDDSSNIQRAAAEFYSQIVNLRLTGTGPVSIPWFQTLMGAYQDAMVYGICVSKQTWDFGMDKPTIRLIEPENIRFDPSADWIDPINSSSYLIEMIPMNVWEVKRNAVEKGWRKLSDGQIALGKTGSTGSSTVQNARENGRENPLEMSAPISDYDTVWVHLNIVKRDGFDFVFYTLGTHFMLTDPVEISEVFLHGIRPYTLGKAILEAHKNYPSGIPDITRDIQRQINDVANQRMDNVKLVLDKRIFIKRGQNVDMDSIRLNAPGSVTMLNDPQKDVNIVSTPDVTGSSYREQDLLNIEMDDMTGGFNSSTVQSNRSLNETVGGMSLLSQSANQVMEYQLKTFTETWVEPVLRQILRLEQEYETDETIMMIAGKKAALVNEFGISEISENLLMQELMLSVSVGMGAVNPATHVERFMMAVRSISSVVPGVAEMLDPMEVAKEVFGKLGYKDGNRFFKKEDQDPEKTALMQKVQELEQKLAQKKSPELEAAEVMLKKAQAVKTGVEASFGAMQAADVVAKNPMTAPIADNIMEAAGYEDLIAPGSDPNMVNQTAGDPNVMTGIDPAVAQAAAIEAQSQDFGVSTNPLQPQTGFENMNIGFRGGKNGVSDRD